MKEGPADKDPAIDKDPWLKKANSAYDTSTTFSNTNWRKQWENNLRMFQSRHVQGSKYNTEAYKYRSKLFRPKTRSAIRATEAAGAAAFFSSMDVVSIQEVGQSPEQKAGAKLIKELLSHHLAQKEMHWFLTIIGGLQDAQKMGVVASYNYWKHEDREGAKKIDHPCVELYPVDQVLFHPGANWIDPVNTSPYLIRKIPMFIQDVKENEEFEDCSEDELQQALIDYNDLSSTRNRNQESPQQAKVEHIDDFSMVWVHEVILRQKGRDIIYYTLHTVKRLTKPKSLDSVYWHGERPVTMGFYIIESHRAMPPGTPELGEQLQKEGNEIVNTRQDNVKLALNKRYLVKRGAQVNLRSLLRNAAGSATIVDNTADDVRELEWNDVTRSSYEEQNRIDVDFDDLVGNFSGGSVKNNRSMSETVGGMNMIQSAAGQLTDYGLKTFSETWYEPTISQVAKLIQYYESDRTVIGVAADKAEIWEEIQQVTEELMKSDLLITVDIGVGTSNPGFRLERLISGVGAVTKIMAEAPPNMDIEEVVGEIFGYLGYKDGSRFFTEGEEKLQIEQLMQEIQRLTQELESKEQDNKAKLIMAEGKEENAMKLQEEKSKLAITLEAMKQHGADNDVRMEGIEESVQNMANLLVKNYNYGS